MSDHTNTADVVFTGGTILTMDEAHPTAEAVAVRDGMIVRVGRADYVNELAGPATQVRDLGTSTLLPGFIDPHSHFINSLAMSEQVNISPPPVGPC
jgi:predicted amidohydrolase YtcJ